MADKHYHVEEEVSVMLTVKVKNIKIHNYYPLTEAEIAENLEDFKKEITDELKGELKARAYHYKNVTLGVDGWSFEVE